jgi:ElaB/YqjD/DUF883 family membrane-anchored ribosome-binding protein
MFNSPNKDSNTINLSNDSSEIIENINEVAHEAGRKVRGAMQTACDEASHVTDYIGAEIRNNPIRSGLIIVGFGILIGSLLRR